MIRYQLNLLDVEISLDSNAPHTPAMIEFKGEPVEVAIARDWLANQYGAFGHIIGDDTTPVDLAAALTKNPRYLPELLEGEELLDFSVDIPDDAVT